MSSEEKMREALNQIRNMVRKRAWPGSVESTIYHIASKALDEEPKKNFYLK